MRANIDCDKSRERNRNGNRRPVTRWLLAALLNLIAVDCRADSLGLDFVWGSATDGARADTPFTVGWTFTVASNFYVTQLGVWDESGFNPNHSSHPVGLWNDSGMLLATQTVAVTSPLFTTPQGTTIRFVPIQPVELFAGQTYRIGAEYTANLYLDFYVDAPGSLVPNSSIIYGGTAASVANAGLAFPSILNPTAQGYFGPDFMLAPVPEPGVAQLGWIALGMIFFEHRRRRFSQMQVPQRTKAQDYRGT
jgi:hypothetical protein